MEQKQKEADEARELYKQGCLVAEIARIMHYTPKTINNYMYGRNGYELLRAKTLLYEAHAIK